MAVKYIPFFPEPIEGQALLNNFNRTLRYRGVEDLNGRLRRGMPFYEVETTEKVGNTDTDNMIIRGECLSACAYLKEQGIKVDLVYIDPPFASGADYAKKVYVRRNPKVAEAISKAETELDIDELKAFEETMYKFIDEDKSVIKDFVELRDLKAVLDDVVAADYAEYKVNRATEELCGQTIEKEGFDIEITKFISDRVIQKIQDFNAKNMGADKKKHYQPIIISDEGLETIEYISVDCTSAEGPWHSDSEIKIDKLGYVIRNGQKTKDFWDARIYAPKQPLRLKIRNICGDETIYPCLIP